MKTFVLAFVLALLSLPLGAQTATATVGTALSVKLAAPGSSGYLYSTNGSANALPPGLSYSNSTGLLTGTPTAAGTYSITLEQDTATAGIYITSTLALTVSAAGAVVTQPASNLFCASSTNAACGVALTCTASTSSTAASPGTVTIQRATISTGPWTTLTTTAPPNCAYTDATIAPSTTYQYQALFTQNGQTSGPSNIAVVQVPAVVVAPPPAPNPPVNLNGTVAPASTTN